MGSVPVEDVIRKSRGKCAPKPTRVATSRDLRVLLLYSFYIHFHNYPNVRVHHAPALAL